MRGRVCSSEAARGNVVGCGWDWRVGLMIFLVICINMIIAKVLSAAVGSMICIQRHLVLTSK